MQQNIEKNALAREVSYLVDALKIEWQKSKNPVAYFTINPETVCRIKTYVVEKTAEMEGACEDPDLPLVKSICCTRDNYVRLRLLRIVLKAEEEMIMKNLKKYGIALDEEEYGAYRDFKNTVKENGGHANELHSEG